MVYPMPLINDLLEDLESTLWYFSLDMARRFWVVKMTDRACLISAFITPFGLFEWNRMPFGLKNAPQIYQRMIDNVLCGFTRIPKIAGDLERLDVFEAGEPEDPGKPSVLGRRSYIDDILVPANNWGQLCVQQMELAISVVKSFWGMPKVEYLGHKVSHDGLETNPIDLSALTDLEFPGSLRAMQSSLARDPNPVSRDPTLDSAKMSDTKKDNVADLDPLWIHAHRSFKALMEKIAITPILRHFDPDLQAVVVVYASDWAISGALVQEYDQVYYPVMFASRTLKSNELNYGIAQKEVLALLRILDLNYITLVGRRIQVMTRHSTLAWLFGSNALQSRLVQWAALLSLWILEIVKCNKGEDEILGTLAAGITPRSEIAPKKEPRRKIQAPIPTVRSDEDLYVASFDGSARAKRGRGAYSMILSGYAEGLTVNEAKYHGLLLCLDLLEGTDPLRLVICGDSNLVIRQVRGEIDWKAPGLTQKALDRLRIRPDHELVRVKRDWNGSADNLASDALQRQCGIEVETDSEIQDLITLNRLEEILVVNTEDPIEGQIRREIGIQPPPVLCEEVIRELRIERIRQAQDEEAWIHILKKYLVGEIRDLTQEEAKSCGSIAMNYEVDQHDLLSCCPTTKESAADRDKLM
ncbi:LOW QUALITY PROTEIN: reverse transcriptase, partial [Phytophthora megakarya]